jgi:hypothetical protein
VHQRDAGALAMAASETPPGFWGIQRTNLYRKVRQLNVPRALLSARK